MKFTSSRAGETGRNCGKVGRSGRPSGGCPACRGSALAIRFDQLIRDGVVADQAELARLGHVTRARLTQIMNLLCLAPDIQEALLFLPTVERGRDAVTERALRPIAGVHDWRRQRKLWQHYQGA